MYVEPVIFGQIILIVILINQHPATVMAIAKGPVLGTVEEVSVLVHGNRDQLTVIHIGALLVAVRPPSLLVHAKVAKFVVP